MVACHNNIERMKSKSLLVLTTVVSFVINSSAVKSQVRCVTLYPKAKGENGEEERIKLGIKSFSNKEPKFPKLAINQATPSNKNTIPRNFLFRRPPILPRSWYNSYPVVLAGVFPRGATKPLVTTEYGGNLDYEGFVEFVKNMDVPTIFAVGQGFIYPDDVYDMGLKKSPMADSFYYVTTCPRQLQLLTKTQIAKAKKKDKLHSSDEKMLEDPQPHLDIYGVERCKTGFSKTAAKLLSAGKMGRVFETEGETNTVKKIMPLTYGGNIGGTSMDQSVDGFFNEVRAQRKAQEILPGQVPKIIDYCWFIAANRLGRNQVHGQITMEKVDGETLLKRINKTQICTNDHCAVISHNMLGMPKLSGLLEKSLLLEIEYDVKKLRDAFLLPVDAHAANIMFGTLPEQTHPHPIYIDFGAVDVGRMTQLWKSYALGLDTRNCPLRSEDISEIGIAFLHTHNPECIAVRSTPLRRK